MRNVTLEQRFTDIFNSALFERLRKESPVVLNKVKYVNGDMLHKGLGLSAEDLKELAENVDIVVHSAASVRFDCLFPFRQRQHNVILVDWLNGANPYRIFYPLAVANTEVVGRQIAVLLQQLM